MTPSELAKVREALLRFIHDDDPDIHDRECPECDPCEGGICCCYVSADNEVISAALAILDREAGRKTRTEFRLEVLLSGEWVVADKASTRERAEKYRANFGEPTRILEVTESWEEPKP